MGIKKPPKYVHPKKGRVEKTENNLSTKNTAAKTELTKKEEGKTAQIRLVARPPKRGTLVLYDRMMDSGLSQKETILALLKQGLRQLDVLIRMSAEDIQLLSYEVDGNAVETNRQIDNDIKAKLQELFDPFGARSARAVGQRVGEALIVLAAKEKENK